MIDIILLCMLTNKKVAVIGGAGFIGSHLADKLVEKDNEVLVIDNMSSGKKDNLNNGAKFILFDIRTHWEKLAKIFKDNEIEYVFHLAAEPYIPDCYKRPFTFFNVNATGTMRVLFACREAGVKKVLYYSTSEVYGTVKEKISEITPVNPQSTYAVSKLAGDRICLTLHREHYIPVVILRQFNCFGPRESHEYVIPEIISQLDKSDILFLGNVEALRDFTYVEDSVKIAIEIMEKGQVGEVYNSGTGQSISIHHIAKLTGKLMDKSFEIKVDNERLRPFDVEKLEADNAKIKELLGQLDFISFEKGLKKTIDYFNKNNKKWDYES